MRYRVLLIVLLMAACTCKAPEDFRPSVTTFIPVGETEPVADDPDDPAIWINSREPSMSIILGTNKVALPNGALYVFDLDGKILQKIGPLDRPNNVDIEQGVRLGDRTYDIAVVTERRAHALRIYSIDPQTRALSEIGNLKVLEGEKGDYSEPMGIALYKRSDGAVFAIVGRKSGPADGYMWQYRLDPGPSLTLVRKFGRFSGAGEIEAIAVDDALGYVYYADEDAGIRKYRADPDSPGASEELAFFGRTGYRGNREGLAIYQSGEREGYIVSTDQIQGSSRYILYRREGASGNPHDHEEVVTTLDGGADSTDGIEVSSAALRPGLPNGLLVAMNSGSRNFLIFRWPSL